ncbi:hypothetical protein BKA93DRAFT_882694 [Sparassis latifolia]
MTSLLTILDAVALALAVYLLNGIFVQLQKGPLPPGPKGWPVIGNIFDMPHSHEWTTFTDWGKKWVFREHHRLFSQLLATAVKWGNWPLFWKPRHIFSCCAFSASLVMCQNMFSRPVRHVPAWILRAGWRKDVKLWTQHFRDMNDIPFNFVKNQLATGTALRGLSANFTEDLSPAKEEILKQAASSFYSVPGGMDTTVSLTHTFFLTMMCYRRLIASSTESKQLPYVNPLYTELLHWNPAVSLGMSFSIVNSMLLRCTHSSPLAHCSNEDGVHAGYFIPKDSLVILNLWLHLNMTLVISYSDMGDHDGHHLAEVSIFIACTMLLAVFNILKPMENDVEMEPTLEYTSGTIIQPCMAYPARC